MLKSWYYLLYYHVLSLGFSLNLKSNEQKYNVNSIKKRKNKVSRSIDNLFFNKNLKYCDNVNSDDDSENRDDKQML